MAVHIRLTRVGATKRPAYRVIAIDSRRSRDGRALEILGYYNPLTDPITVQLDTERIATWMARGARPSAAVERLMKADTAPRPAAAAPKPKRAKATKAEPTAETKAAAVEAAEPMAAAGLPAEAETPAQAATEQAAEATADAPTDAAPSAEATEAEA